MKYAVKLINPRTGQEKTIVVAAKPPAKGVDVHEHVQAIARPAMPSGFLPIGNGVQALQ